MPRPRIFISHAAADGPGLCRRLHDALQTAGFEVLLDQARLAGGDDWRNEIYTWIQQAHGAIVVLSNTSTESPWVKFELAALVSRRLLSGGDVKLVPILALPVTDAVLREKKFDPYDLAKLQGVTIDPNAADAVIDDAVGRVVDLFRPLLVKCSDAPIDVLETKIVRELPPEADVLERAAQALAAQGVVNATLIARSFFHAAAENVRDALAQIAGGRGVQQSQLRLIFDIVTPFWVEPEAIIELAREAANPAGPHRILLLNTGDRSIGLMYVRRAALQHPLTWAVIPVSATGGDDPVGSIVGEMRDYFRKLDFDSFAYATEADIDQYMADLAAAKTPVVVILPPSTKLERVGELRGLYPKCIFVRLSGADIPDPATLTAMSSVVLEPRLGADREKTIKIEYGKCVVVLKNTRT